MEPTSILRETAAEQTREAARQIDDATNEAAHAGHGHLAQVKRRWHGHEYIEWYWAR
jgi:hypothetical protein